MAKKEQVAVEQPQETPAKEEPVVVQQMDVIETKGLGTFTLPDGTIKTNH